MTPERWKQIEQLYHWSLNQDPNQRADFLKEACVGDQELQREVESLLAFEPRAESFIEDPPRKALEDAARGLAEDGSSTLLKGDIGHYQILSRLGEGGMGVVYKARDKQLGRFVAIKVLAAGLVTDPEHRRRLVLEARMASGLNHPNIVTVHEVSSQDDVDFIVMECVAGKTLDQLIPPQGMPLKESLTYAIQIADGLAAAHTAGIIHRDIKPGNVMVTNSGLVKVLDFGLAKLTGKAPSTTSDAPTIPGPGSGPKTQAGIMLGTVSYMSPEQAEGKPLDARSDIFSFGLVLYEMVTGQRAFAGDSNLAILTAILREEPKPASEIVKGIPTDLDKIIGRCLRKEPERRWQTMTDVKIALHETKEELSSAAPAVSGRPRAHHRSWISFALGLALLATLSLVIWLNRSATKVAEAPLTATPLTTYPGEERDPSLSPDGNQVAFSWSGEKQDNFDIYVKDIKTGAQLRLTTGAEEDFCPAWAPDGRSIAFIRAESGRRASLFQISPFGPPERKIAEMIRGGPSWPWRGGVAWTPDGKSLIVSGRDSVTEAMGLFSVSVESGERRRLTSSPEKRFGDMDPAVSPDGRTVAFIRRLNYWVSDIYVLALSEGYQPNGEPKRLTFENHESNGPVWTADGREIIFSSGPYFSPKLFRIAGSGPGKPQRLAAVGENGSQPTISRRAQRLAYTSAHSDVNVWRLQLPGLQRRVSQPTRLLSSTWNDQEAQFSPDGKKIAFVSNRTGGDEIWVCDSDGSNAQQLTSLLGTGNCGAPRWSPDGKLIAFDSSVDGHWEIYVIGLAGGKPRRVTSSPRNNGIPSWSHDGKWIYFRSEHPPSQIWKVPAEGGEAVQITKKGGVVALESADSNWIYYTKADGDSSLWKVPKDGGEETQVLQSVAGRAFTVVREGIYFIPKPASAAHHCIQFFDFATERIRRVSLDENRMLDWYLSVSPDGRWILYSQDDQVGSDLMLVENFR